MSGYATDKYDSQRRKLGETIKKIRGGRDMTQEELAHKAGLNAAHLGKIEIGKINITLRSLIRIAKVMDVKVRDLFEF